LVGSISHQALAASPDDDLREALERSREDGKPLAVLFGARWCPYCETMREETLPSAELNEFEGRYRWVRVDIDRQLDLAREYDVDAVPLTLLVDPQERRQRRIRGFLTGAQLAMALERFEGGPPPAEVDEVSGGPASTLLWAPKGYRSRSICFGQVGYGPLRLSSQSPFQSLRFTPMPRTPSTLARGDWELTVSGTWSNVWAPDDSDGVGAGDFGAYLLDYETLHGVASLSYGVTNTLQVEIGYEQRHRFSGDMDGLIQGFHDLLGIGQNGRDDVPRDRLFIYLDPDGDGDPIFLDEDDGGLFVRNASLTIQHNVTCGTEFWPAVSYAVTGRFNLDAPDLRDEGTDIGLSVSAARRWGELYAYASLAGARFDATRTRGDLQLRETQVSGLFAAEWRFAPRQSFVVQYLVTQGALESDFPALDAFRDASHEVTLGWKIELIDRGVLEIGLVENIITFDNSPDFGIHAGWTQRF
jgi:thiol-disulfide isomerase/thioredoxin